MENLSQNNLKKVAETQDLSRSKLDWITKTRDVKDYKNTLKENLLIAFLKSEQSVTELRRSKDNTSEIEEIKFFLMN